MPLRTRLAQRPRMQAQANASSCRLLRPSGLITLTRTRQVGGAVEHFPLDKRLRSLARRQPGCVALMRHCGIGGLTALAILAELGDARRFSSSRDAVRYAGLDVTVHESDRRRAAGHLSRGGSPGAALGTVRGRPGRAPLLARPTTPWTALRDRAAAPRLAGSPHRPSCRRPPAGRGPS